MQDIIRITVNIHIECKVVRATVHMLTHIYNLYKYAEDTQNPNHTETEHEQHIDCAREANKIQFTMLSFEPIKYMLCQHKAYFTLNIILSGIQKSNDIIHVGFEMLKKPATIPLTDHC